jgi:hypothetical protein
MAVAQGVEPREIDRAQLQALLVKQNVRLA